MPDSEFLFLGAEGKMEMELVPREGYPIRPLKITNISRGRSLSAVAHNLNTVKNVIDSEREAKALLQAFQPDAVIGTGGYVCYPVLMAASRLHIPTLVHESNAAPGLTTKLLAKHVDRILVGFEESRRHYPDPARVKVTGTPVRGEFARISREQARRELGLDPDTPLVVSVWGSLGSGHMNRILTEMLPLLGRDAGFHLIHSIGSRDYQEVSEKLQGLADAVKASGADLREYIYDMPRVMAAADLILCRAGASTLAELTYLGKPVIIVPSPNVAENHQEKNARVLEKAGGAKVFLEGEFDAPSLLREVRALLADSGQLRAMARAMRSLSVSDATEKICEEILVLCEEAKA